VGIKCDKELYDYVYPYVKDELVFDVGSNIGEVTKKFINAGARVVAIEPQIKITNGDNYKEVYAVKNMCISNEIGNVVFYTNNRATTTATCFEDWKRVQHSNTKWTKMTMPATTLDALIDEFGKPKYIKIDVEGYEHKVLGGLSCKINFISFEFTESYWETFFESIKIIEKLGFKKMTTFQKKKIKKTVDGRKKTIKSYKIVDEFFDVPSVLEFFKKLPNRVQGDILIEV
jgi:FkbM family methyltransferase